MAADQGPMLPAGRYFMVLWGISESFGGMTTMSLHRAGAFRQHGGRTAAVLTFESKPSYETLLERLRSQGKIDPAVEVLNIFQYYRSAASDGGAPDGGSVPAPVPADAGTTGVPEVVFDPEGRVFMRTLMRPDGETMALRVYYRQDGTEYFRDESPVDAAGRTLGRYLTLLDRAGRPVRRWRKAGDFYRHWLLELTAAEQTVLVVDSAVAAGVVGPLQAEHLLKLVVVHNSHIAAGGDPFQGKLAGTRKGIFEGSWAWDGLVFLTRRQQADYEQRFGAANNLFTVSNPKARTAALPPFEARHPNRGVMAARLEPQKNLAEAVAIMALVSRRLPDAVLDIYGTGSQREALQEMIDDAGLAGVVRLRGHAPNAAAEFETARFSLLTSRFEGQPLALMESLGRGCPPVAYNIRYGPDDVVENGRNGFLVAAGDQEAAADRVVRLCTDDQLARSLGQAAWVSSGRFSDAAVTAQWARVVEQAWLQAPERLAVPGLDFTLAELSFEADGGFRILGDLTWQPGSGPPAEQYLEANLVIGRRTSGPPEFLSAQVVQRQPGGLRISAGADGGQLGYAVSMDNHELDIFLQVHGRNVLRTFRIGFPGPAPSWRPYATIHGSLSLKHA
ncbi:glycosyltransferase [Arthrobacter sp. I2-34]|uniref:Glycosyltransferase n=1 Tax=Arthrobacter hankyongi TaxID=2904801 RepID=A0ABS9L6Z5_9MICC|nr:glycosyltransferase [Arthrobacter hankyongi]MCG2622259.1 glycosyltransferase [Arthrobacter hankyongi]